MARGCLKLSAWIDICRIRFNVHKTMALSWGWQCRSNVFSVIFYTCTTVHVYAASISRNCLSLLKQIREVEIPTNFSIMKALYFNILFTLKYFLFAKDYGKIIMPPYFFAMVNWCVLIDIRLFWSRTNLSFTFYFWRIMGITLSNLHIKMIILNLNTSWV